MSAHRYWRVNLPPINPSNGTLLSTLELRTTVGGVDVAAGATRSGSHGAVAPWFDGSDGTENYATGGTVYVNFDFGSPVEIREIRLRTGSNGSLAPDVVTLWHSDSASGNWLFTSLRGITASLGANTAALYSGWTYDISPSPLLTVPPFKLVGDAMPATPTWKLTQPLAKLRDMYFGGTGRIAGTVKEQGTPANIPLRRRVWLMRERDAIVIRETWSDVTTGAYSFDNVDATQKYTVITYDYEHDKRAVIADNITPDPMP